MKLINNTRRTIFPTWWRFTNIIPKTCLLVGMIIISVSCNTPNKTDHNSSPIDLSDSSSYVVDTIIINSDQAVECPFNEIIKEYNIIDLEMTSESVIGVPDRVLLKGGFLFIKENDVIHIFNTDGSHKTTINKKGRGPGEYVQIQGFDFIQERNRVAITDYHKIHIYDLEGNYLSNLSSPWRFFQIASFEDRFVVSPFVLSGNPEIDYNVILTDTNLKILDKRDKLPIWQGPFFIVSGTTLRSSNLSSTISYASYYGDTIFTIDQLKIEPRYVLNYDKKYHVTGDFLKTSENSYYNIVFRETHSKITVEYSDYLTKLKYLVIVSKDSLGQTMNIKNSFLNFDNISDEGPYQFVASGQLKKTISKFDKDLTFCMNASTVKEYLADELKHNGFLIQFRWKQ